MQLAHGGNFNANLIKSVVVIRPNILVSKITMGVYAEYNLSRQIFVCQYVSSGFHKRNSGGRDASLRMFVHLNW